MSLPSNFVNQSTRLALYMRDDFRCVYCGEKLPRNVRILSLDHVVARSKTQDHETHNLVTCCHRCNSKKRDLTVWEYALKYDLDFLEIDERIRQATIKNITPFFNQALALLDNMSYKKAIKKADSTNVLL